jgi:PII-like signaling protein
MDLPAESRVLRFLVGERARHGQRPLRRAVVLEARQTRLTAATAVRCVQGHGKSGRVRKSRVLRPSDDLPLVVEGMAPSGLAALARVRAQFYRGVRAPA